MIKLLKKLICFLITVILILSLAVFGINLYVLNSGNDRISDVKTVADASYILVFGASVHGKTVSHALAQRLDMVCELYNRNKSKKVIVSGDHLTSDYNEVQAMKDYLVKKGIPNDNIIMDHSGIDTYVSILRLKDRLSPQSVIFVTQEEHLKRALYFAKKLDINAFGVPCENYSDEELNFQHKREFLARMKAFVVCELLGGDTEKFDNLLRMITDESFD